METNVLGLVEKLGRQGIARLWGEKIRGRVRWPAGADFSPNWRGKKKYFSNL
jgi:hypothetical protein